ncbi:MAG TPA: hypothetical protein VL860_11585 [Planctomycetota bacterium]|nr:hypothetical protein [Planctomycetota bacterium]
MIPTPPPAQLLLQSVPAGPTPTAGVNALLWTASRPPADDPALFEQLAASNGAPFAPIHSQGLRRMAPQWRQTWRRMRRWSWIELWWGALLPVLVYSVGATHLYQEGRYMVQSAAWPVFVTAYPLFMLLLWRVWNNARANAWLREQFNQWRADVPAGISAAEFAAARPSPADRDGYAKAFDTLWQECDPDETADAPDSLTPPDRIGASAALKSQILALRAPPPTVPAPATPPPADLVGAAAEPTSATMVPVTVAVVDPLPSAEPVLGTSPTALSQGDSSAPVLVSVPMPVPVPVSVAVSVAGSTTAPPVAPLPAPDDLRNFCLALEQIQHPPVLPAEFSPTRRRIRAFGTVVTVTLTVILLAISAGNLRRDVELYLANTSDEVVSLYVDGQFKRELEPHWVEHFYIPDAGRHTIEIRSKTGERLWRRIHEFARGSYGLNPENDAWQFVWHEFHIPGEHSSVALPGSPTRGIVRLPDSPDWGPNDALSDPPLEPGRTTVRTWLQLRHVGGEMPPGGDELVPTRKKSGPEFDVDKNGDLLF